jgi:hypothetical protein
LELIIVEDGIAIGRTNEKGELEQLSFPFETIEKAQQFLTIANYGLKFIPSALPHVQERFNAL